MKKFIPMKGVCAMGCNIEIDDNNKLVSLEFLGGCDGNHKGLDALCRGMDVDEIAEKLEGITCGRRSTSCPDQLSRALRLMKGSANA